ncbi:XRE family transcriptional regulator [Streptococcus suis]|nr:XRE family transcriptional regulator [Streptococcus suis]KPA67643.1 XRE family transcriptional regulator [Streptococcus suis]
MNFGQQIKDLRKKKGLTQEQFALKLNVTRQAVSNWENDKNLPDLELLILMSSVFSISLDHLILGGTDMNNMTEKLVKDGREGRRTQMHLTITIIGSFLMVLGLVCFFVKANSVEYIDAEGILRENFYLIPIGFLFLLVGGMTSLISAITYLRFRKEHK